MLDTCCATDTILRPVTYPSGNVTQNLYFSNVRFSLSCRVRFLVDTSFLCNKTLEGSNIWVHAGIQRFCTTNSPGNNASQFSIHNQGSARITLASVFTSTRHSSTNHVLSDSIIWFIIFVAFFPRYYWHIDHLKLTWKCTRTWGKGPPAGDSSILSRKRLWIGQCNRLHSCSESEVRWYLKEKRILMLSRIIYEITYKGCGRAA